LRPGARDADYNYSIAGAEKFSKLRSIELRVFILIAYTEQLSFLYDWSRRKAFKPFTKYKNESNKLCSKVKPENNFITRRQL